MDDMKLAKWLNGTESKGKDPGRVRYYYGTAIEDSADGKVKIRTDGTMITQDNQDYVELNCYGHISKGDVVRISSVNSVPAAEDGVGWGDKMHVDITLNGNAIDALEENVATIETNVDEAAKVATNYMDFDEEGLTGLTIGNMTDETLGNNVNINANGIDLREDVSTVVARFAASLIELGRNKLSSIIKMCAGALQILAKTEQVGQGITATTGTITASSERSTAHVDLSSGAAYSRSSMVADNGSTMVQSEVHTDTGSGSSQSGLYSRWNQDAKPIPASQSYTRGEAGVSTLTNPTQSHASLSSTYQLGQGGTVFNAALHVRATGAGGSEATVSASFYDSVAATPVTVYLKPIYRLRNPNGYFLFTASASEKTQAVRDGWIDEGVGFYAFK